LGGVSLDPVALWTLGDAPMILLRGAVVGFVEELLLRGFLLFAPVHVWGASRRGLLGATTVTAMIFALTHIFQFLAGNAMDDTLLTMVNAFVGGLRYAMLILLSGSLWF
jgi:membrane protease YdiL (CAAX protease family)